MSNDAQFDREHEDGARERERVAGSAGSRRALLGGAASGFALAASGLALPEWLVEEAAAADSHPLRRVQNRQDGQRTQRRRRLERRRDANRRQRDKDANEDKPRGTFDPFNIFVGVRFTNEQQTLTQRAHLSFQTYNDPGFGMPKTWETQKTATLALEETTSYKFGVPKARVVVDVPDVARWVEIENPSIGYPLVTVYNQDRSREDSFSFDAGEEHLFGGTAFEGKILKVKRNKDTPGYKNFVIDVLALGYFCTTC